MIVVLGAGANQQDLTRKILDWEEIKVRRVPRKLDVGSTSAFRIETDASNTKGRDLKLTCRLTLAERMTLYDLQAEHAWQPLTDDAVLLDYYWIEGVLTRIREVEDNRRDWLTTITCIASNS